MLGCRNSSIYYHRIADITHQSINCRPRASHTISAIDSDTSCKATPFPPSALFSNRLHQRPNVEVPNRSRQAAAHLVHEFPSKVKQVGQVL